EVVVSIMVLGPLVSFVVIVFLTKTKKVVPHLDPSVGPMPGLEGASFFQSAGSVGPLGTAVNVLPNGSGAMGPEEGGVQEGQTQSQGEAALGGNAFADSGSKTTPTEGKAAAKSSVEMATLPAHLVVPDHPPIASASLSAAPSSPGSGDVSRTVTDGQVPV